MHSAYKVCPECQAQSVIDAPACTQCGHKFRTQFVQPQQATQAFYAPLPQHPYPPAPAFTGTHSKVVAGVLAILLGGLGIHAFYMGHTSMGIIILLISLVGGIATCGIAAGVMGIITLVQGILYLVASDWEFHQKYVIEGRWF